MILSVRVKSSLVVNFLDQNNIIRVGGRLENIDLPISYKHPIVLSNKHTLTKLIISHEHIRNMHSGILSTLSIVRQNYWPLDRKQTVRGIIRKCIPCFKAKPRCENPMMGNLPSHRLSPSPPFSFCGVDFAGPFNIKDGKTRNKKIIKSYICVFICLSTKAVHIELATELSTQCFLNALRRFISRSGFCKT